MSRLHRAVCSVRNDGLGATATKAWAMMHDLAFDVRYGVETRSWDDLTGADIVGEHRANAVIYQPTRVGPLRELLRKVRPHLRADDVFVDYGCGKGRVLLLAAAAGFRAVRGVEFAGGLCEIARRNCAIFQRRSGARTEFAVTHADASLHPVAPDESVFFMFNPFDDFVMQKVYANIARSVAEHPRRILLLLHMPPRKQFPGPPGMREFVRFTHADGEYVGYRSG